MFAQPFVQAQIKENIKALRHWPLWGEFFFHRSPVNSPHKGPVTRKMFPFDDVIMILCTRFIVGVSYDVGQRSILTMLDNTTVDLADLADWDLGNISTAYVVDGMYGDPSMGTTISVSNLIEVKRVPLLQPLIEAGKEKILFFNIEYSWCQLCGDWWHRRLSLWYPPVRHVIINLASWRPSASVNREYLIERESPLYEQNMAHKQPE